MKEEGNGPFGLPEYSQAELDELERELESERRTELKLIEMWEKLTAKSKGLSLSKGERRDLRYCELHFGGREKLLKRRAYLKREK